MTCAAYHADTAPTATCGVGAAEQEGCYVGHTTQAGALRHAPTRGPVSHEVYPACLGIASSVYSHNSFHHALTPLSPRES